MTNEELSKHRNIPHSKFHTLLRTTWPRPAVAAEMPSLGRAGRATFCAGAAEREITLANSASASSSSLYSACKRTGLTGDRGGAEEDAGLIGVPGTIGENTRRCTVPTPDMTEGGTDSEFLGGSNVENMDETGVCSMATSRCPSADLERCADWSSAVYG